MANPINTGDTNCGAGISSLSFQHPVNGPISYSLSGTEVQRMENSALSIISNPDVEVTRLSFCISGNTVNDDKHPRVTIILSIRAGKTEAESASIDLQTTVSQRVLSD